MSFPVTLLFPPQGHFTQPYLALPCLKAYLRANGFDDVDLIDASVESYDWFLSAEYLTRAAELARERLPLKRFEALEELPFDEMDAFRAAAECAVGADTIVADIEEAKTVLRSEAFYDPDRYVPAVRTLYQGLRLVSAAHHPSVLTPHNFTMAYANDRSAEVLAATRDRQTNPYIRYYEEELLPRLIRRQPRLLGLSVIYGSQLIPALTLGRLVKEHLPDCHITAGGGFLAYIGRKLMSAPGVDEALDSIIFWEGEAPLLALAEALREGEALHDVGSLAWFERPRPGATSHVENAPAHPIRLDAAPLPDFTGLPFDKYFSPELVLPYDVNRGCYYGECTFCTLPTVIGPGYRTRKAGTIAAQIVALRDRYDTRNFNFITDCMPPGMISDLPDALLERRADVRWWSDARVEPKAYTPEGAEKLYAAGCRKLLFGFETATPRILKLMKKGQSARATLDVARNCDAAGISVTFYAMVGFPSETHAEAQATLDFLLENSDVVREVSLQTFHIDEVAETYQHPENFGIEILDDPEADLQLYHDYVAKSGMTSGEAAEAFERMMSGFRAHLPLFAGDNIFYFMQKSHYFMHLARDVRPTEFATRMRARRERNLLPRELSSLRPAPRLRSVRLPFSYAAVVKRLADPRARAIRPDFLTGRYVEGAREEAVRSLGSLERAPRVLVHAGEGSDFAELRPDGELVLHALQRAGTLGELIDTLPSDRPGQPGDRGLLEDFARGLERLGLVRAPTFQEHTS